MNDRYKTLVSTYAFVESDGKPLTDPNGKPIQTHITRPDRMRVLPDGTQGAACFLALVRTGELRRADGIVDVISRSSGQVINQIDCSLDEFERLGDPALIDGDGLEDRRAKRAEARAERARREAAARGALPQDPAPVGPLSETYNAPDEPPPPVPPPTTVAAASEEVSETKTTASETKTTNPDLPSNTGNPEEKKGAKPKRRTK